MNRQEARQVLGVKARDSSELIREKYHAKIKLYYPDLHPSRESVRQCMEVIEAYAVLYDIAKQNNLTGKIYVITKYYPFRDLDGKVVFKGKTTKKIMVKFVKGECELK